jgi:hypothetical protein
MGLRLLRARRPPPLAVMAVRMNIALFVSIARLARSKGFPAHATVDRLVVGVLRRHVMSPPQGRGGWWEEQESRMAMHPLTTQSDNRFL